jgi:hypothetical protein
MRGYLLVVFGTIAGLALQGCVLAASVSGSQLESTNANGGTVTRVTQFTEAGAMSLASDYCSQYGKIAVETDIAFRGANPEMNFACTTP